MTFSVIALRATWLQIVKFVRATVHQRNDVVNGVSWSVAVVAGWLALQDDCPVAFVFGVAVFFTHCYRAATKRLALVL